MAYYTALINQWPLLTPGTTAVKLAQLNAMTVTGTVPSAFSVNGGQIYNCMVSTEFTALTAANQQFVRDIFSLYGTFQAGTGTTVQTVLLSIFGVGTTTRANLTALAQAVVQPWWQANGYLAPINASDLLAAGGLV